MNILITGAGGFIASNIYYRLKDKFNFTRIFSPNQKIQKEQCHVIDLTSIAQVKSLAKNLSNTNFDVLIHLASKVASSENKNDISTLEDNISITSNMGFLIKKLCPKYLIHFSSMSVYPNISGSFSEKSLPMPQMNNDCIYGLSKFASEVLLDFLLLNEEIRIIHLRLAQVYGEGMRQDRILPVMRKELENRNTITLYGNGERQSCFINIARLTEIVNYLINNKVKGVFNVGEENVSFNDLAKKTIRQYGNSRSSIIRVHKGSNEKFNLDFSRLQEEMDG